MWIQLCNGVARTILIFWKEYRACYSFETLTIKLDFLLNPTDLQSSRNWQIQVSEETAHIDSEKITFKKNLFCREELVICIFYLVLTFKIIWKLPSFSHTTCGIQENWPHPSPTAALGKTGLHFPREAMGSWPHWQGCQWECEHGRMVLPLIYLMVVQVEGRCPLPQEMYPHPWPLVAGGRVGSEVMRSCETAMHLTSCSNQQSRPCTSPRQHNLLALVMRTQVSGLREQDHKRAGPHTHLSWAGLGGGEMPPISLPLLEICHLLWQVGKQVAGSWEQKTWSCPSVTEGLRRTGPELPRDGIILFPVV